MAGFGVKCCCDLNTFTILFYVCGYFFFLILILLFYAEMNRQDFMFRVGTNADRRWCLDEPRFPSVRRHLGSKEAKPATLNKSITS